MAIPKFGKSNNRNYLFSDGCKVVFDGDVAIGDTANLIEFSSDAACINTTIAGQVVGTINSTIQLDINGTTVYLYGYAGRPTAT